ncbi:diacylglycerol/lipid kinase family protein [Secundilactobacillus paracollinoides]|uniref:Diacylglycerol kinase n=1 Tax=Secundilactobacillus paracollinoides TaxID=240427 RepID=A0A1B2J088_9LACO|nr:diacylglycerol kinase family protein [Secundilactobacillus paracollinoides]ANZ61793.1 diacylglycerol kinase [Secundilactobacillus paracollinoides]ANZ67712.1 diacylglycerol kinase [Secundilactobacillus paracollinoides]
MSVNFYVILNEFAGGGKAKNLWPEIKTVLQERQVSYQVAKSTYPGQATLLARQYAKQHPDLTTATNVVLAVGGDGTLHQVLNGLASAKLTHPIPVAYLPVGNGNDFAKGIKMATRWRSALDQILGCNSASRLNVGTYRDAEKNTTGVFTNTVGIGFDAAVVNDANGKSPKRLTKRLHLGWLSRLSSLISVVYNELPFPLTVHVGQHRDIYAHAYLVTVSNHPYLGGGINIAPTAEVTDPNLDLIVIEKPHLPKLLFIALMLRLGRHMHLKSVHHYHEPKLHLIVPSIEYGQEDGEEMGGRYWDTYFEIAQYPFWIDTTI